MREKLKVYFHQQNEAFPSTNPLCHTSEYYLSLHLQYMDRLYISSSMLKYEKEKV